MPLCCERLKRESRGFKPKRGQPQTKNNPLQPPRYRRCGNITSVRSRARKAQSAMKLKRFRAYQQQGHLLKLDFAPVHPLTAYSTTLELSLASPCLSSAARHSFRLEEAILCAHKQVRCLGVRCDRRTNGELQQAKSSRQRFGPPRVLLLLFSH